MLTSAGELVDGRHPDGQVKVYLSVQQTQTEGRLLREHAGRQQRVVRQ